MTGSLQRRERAQITDKMFTGAWLSLHNMTSTYKSIVDMIHKQNATALLPETYTKEQVQGYLLQRELLIKSYLSDEAGQIELPFGGGGQMYLSLEHPLSRGTVSLNVTDVCMCYYVSVLYRSASLTFSFVDSEPIFDFHTFQ